LIQTYTDLYPLGIITENGERSSCWISKITLHPDDACQEDLTDDQNSKIENKIFSGDVELEERGISVLTENELPFSETIYVRLETAGEKVLCTPIQIDLTCGPISFDFTDLEETTFSMEGT